LSRPFSVLIASSYSTYCVASYRAVKMRRLDTLTTLRKHYLTTTDDEILSEFKVLFEMRSTYDDLRLVSLARNDFFKEILVKWRSYMWLSRSTLLTIESSLFLLHAPGYPLFVITLPQAISPRTVHPGWTASIPVF